MRYVFEVLPGLLLLYGTFVLGQVNQRRKNHDKRDSHAVVRAARQVVFAHSSIDMGGANMSAALKGLELALDEWDAKAL